MRIRSFAAIAPDGPDGEPRDGRLITAESIGRSLQGFERYEPLSLYQKARLSLMLLHALVEFTQQLPEMKGTAIARRVNDILKSLDQLRAFYRSASDETDADPLAIEALNYIMGDDTETVTAFFASAGPIYMRAREVHGYLVDAPDEETGEMPPMMWLVGYKLPMIYQRFFGEYTANISDRGVDGGLVPSDGIRFVRIAIVALGINADPTDATVKSHWFKAQLVRS